MKRLLDTSTLIDILRGEPSVTARFRATRPSDLLISAISAGELAAGAALAREPHREIFALDMLLRPLASVALDNRIAQRAGAIDAAQRKRGARIGVADRLIAATALEHDAVVVTSDTSHFARVPFLVTESWRAA